MARGQARAHLRFVAIGGVGVGSSSLRRKNSAGVRRGRDAGAGRAACGAKHPRCKAGSRRGAAGLARRLGGARVRTSGSVVLNSTTVMFMLNVDKVA